jgi:nucleotide-binding universal stress UspA family protein
MALKNILVHVTDTAQSKLRLEMAVALCEAHDAHLTGLGVRAVPMLPPYSMAAVPDIVRGPFEAQQSAAVIEARKNFDTMVSRAGWTGRSSWLEREGHVTAIVGQHARYVDLTVTGQDSPEREPFEISTIDLVLRSGRPVLVTPYGTAYAPIGKRITVAWNGSREAARAVSDAMPLLTRAEAVEVVTIAADSPSDVPGADIAAHLAQHGVTVELKLLGDTADDSGAALLNYVGESGADMVVMGAYGRSRFSEWIFGGVTRHILQEMKVPVLMSH